MREQMKPALAAPGWLTQIASWSTRSPARFVCPMEFRSMWIYFALFCGMAWLPNKSYAQAVSGPAVAVDGDSLTINGRGIRLFGIDAPEFDQLCTRDNASWRCGEEAKGTLADLVNGHIVECQGQGIDQYARLIAVCSAGGLQLNETMVEYGWAIAYREFSDAYASAEARAKSHRLGIWSSQFQSPSDYRLSQLPSPVAAPVPRATPTPRRAAPSSPSGCVIKGNRNRRGQWIYYLPEMPYYDQTRAEEMFCTEAEAQAAGYRRAIVRN